MELSQDIRNREHPYPIKGKHDPMLKRTQPPYGMSEQCQGEYQKVLEKLDSAKMGPKSGYLMSPQHGIWNLKCAACNCNVEK